MNVDAIYLDELNERSEDMMMMMKMEIDFTSLLSHRDFLKTVNKSRKNQVASPTWKEPKTSITCPPRSSFSSSSHETFTPQLVNPPRILPSPQSFSQTSTTNLTTQPPLTLKSHTISLKTNPPTQRMNKHNAHRDSGE